MNRYKGFERVKDQDLVNAVSMMEKTLPRKLRGLRESMGLHLSEVARDTGITKQAISLYETGVNCPTLQRAVILAAYYGVTVDWLIWDEGDTP